MKLVFLFSEQRKTFCLVSFFIIGMIVLNFWFDLSKEEIFSRADDISKKNSIVVSLEQKAGAFLGSSLFFNDISEEINLFEEEFGKILGIRTEVESIH